MRAEYFFGFIISFIVGVALEQVLGIGYTFSVLFFVLAIVVLLLNRISIPSVSGLFVSFLLFGCALGIWRVDVLQFNTAQGSLDHLAGKVYSFNGIVVSEPDVREKYTNIVFESRSVLYGETNLELKDHPLILVRVPVYPEFHYGDELALVGKAMPAKNFEQDANVKFFDYRSYLAKDNIYYQMYFPSATFVSHKQGNDLVEILLGVKAWLIKNISKSISEPEASLASGITLGAKQSLGEELLQKFRETGVAHIVVLSGYNIAVVAGIISRMVIFMPFVWRMVASATGIVLFAVMVGGGVTVVRATIMAIVIILARLFGRESDALRVLVLAGGMMVFANPMILLHDVSFQLSFSATLAIVVFVPVVEKCFAFIGSRILREIIVTTFATQVFVLPLILYHMGGVSLIGFIANIFILPVVPVAMLAVSLVATFAWMPLVGGALSFAAHAVLAYVIFVVDIFARAPFASLHDISFSLSALAITYLLIGGFIVKKFPYNVQDKKSEYEF